MAVIIKNGKTYGDRSVSLTQAEYNALSETEKNNGTVYYIYDANAVPQASDVVYDNTESGLNASNVQGAIDKLKNGLIPFPDYSHETNIVTSFPSQPVSSTTAGYTFPTDALVFFTADRSAQGFTLYAYVDGHNVATIPAHVAFGGVALTLLVRKGSTLVFKTDSTSATWVIRVVKYFPLVLS